MKCESCSYYSYTTQSCDYIFIVGHSRGCKGGDECVKYVNGKRRKSISEMAFRDYDAVNKRRERQEQNNKIRMELYNKGMTDDEIARETKMTAMCIRLWRGRNGLPPVPNQNRTDEERMKYYGQGLSDAQIGKRLGCSESCIFRWRKLKGLKANNPVPEIDYGKAVELYEMGMTDSQIGKEIGTSSESVRKWRKRNGLQTKFRRGGK